jgi:hypothetical protein
VSDASDAWPSCGFSAKLTFTTPPVSRTWKRNEARVFDVCEFDVYEIVVKMLLASGFFPEDFALKATNFYFPKQNFAPPNFSTS